MRIRHAQHDLYLIVTNGKLISQQIQCILHKNIFWHYCIKKYKCKEGKKTLSLFVFIVAQEWRPVSHSTDPIAKISLELFRNFDLSSTRNPASDNLVFVAGWANMKGRGHVVDLVNCRFSQLYKIIVSSLEVP